MIAPDMGAGVVLVGAGQAGLQVALSLREGGYAGPVTLLGDEPGLPYGRPALSKAFLKGSDGLDTLWLRPGSALESRNIRLLPAVRATAIDRERRQILIATGGAVPYDVLVLATGTRNRALPVPGADLAGVMSLRDHADAVRLRAALASARNLVVVGGGFLGLEVASTAAATGSATVHVVESGSRLMGRAVSRPVSDFFLRQHTALGVDIRLNEGVAGLEGTAGQVRAVRLRSGGSLPADLVLAAVGVVPNVELAAAAGLDEADGIVVDGAMRTADPSIFAVGDCALHPSVHAAVPLRIESVQNATDQARCVASNILGRTATYDAVPWFWSDQGGARLQIAGLRHADDEAVVVGEGEAFSVRSFRAGCLTCVESVNRPQDHVRVRKELAAERAPAAA